MLRTVLEYDITSFLVSDSEETFNKFRLAFITVFILPYFDFERHIRLKTDNSGYAIRNILCQLISDTWHPIAYYWQKMILVENRYETHDYELLTIIEVFKI